MRQLVAGRQGQRENHLICTGLAHKGQPDWQAVEFSDWHAQLWSAGHASDASKGNDGST